MNGRAATFGMRVLALCFIGLNTLLIGCGEKSSPETSSIQMNPGDPAFKKGAQERLALMQAEELVREEAPWFGKTGLPDDDERELPRYLRREFGKVLSEPGALQARDLEYLGVFMQQGETVHYWRINYPMANNSYAYVVTAPPGHEQMGWSGREPPK